MCLNWFVFEKSFECMRCTANIYIVFTINLKYKFIISSVNKHLESKSLPEDYIITGLS